MAASWFSLDHLLLGVKLVASQKTIAAAAAAAATTAAAAWWTHFCFAGDSKEEKKNRQKFLVKQELEEASLAKILRVTAITSEEFLQKTELISSEKNFFVFRL